MMMQAKPKVTEKSGGQIFDEFIRAITKALLVLCTVYLFLCMALSYDLVGYGIVY